MIAVCAPAPAGAAFVRRMLDFVDCQAQAIGAGGYQALAAPGSMLSIVLTGLLTLFVALLGYRMLFGHTPARPRRRAGAGQDRRGARAGDELDRLPHPDLRRRAARPGRARRQCRPPGGAAGAGGAPGRPSRLRRPRLRAACRGAQTLPLRGAAAAAAGHRRAPEMFPGFNTFALGGARATYLIGALGALALVRLVAGLLLALGPFFIAFLLFDGTRGLFEGWVRVLAGAALGRARHRDRARRRARPARALARRPARPPLCGAADHRRAGRTAGRDPAVRARPARHPVRLGAGRFGLPHAADLARGAGADRRGAARRAGAARRRPAGRRIRSPPKAARAPRPWSTPSMPAAGARRPPATAATRRWPANRRAASGRTGRPHERRFPPRRRSARASAAAPPPASRRARADGTLPDEEADTRSAQRLLCRGGQLGP